MADKEGLPPPTLAPSPRPSIARTPDLERGTVDRELTDIINDQNPYVGRLANAATSHPPGQPTFRAFKEGGDGLRPVQSHLEGSFDANSPELTLAKFLGSSIASPFTAGVDAYQVGKIRDLQKAFFDKHGAALMGLARDLSHAKGTMRQLGEWLAGQSLPTNDIRGIMDRKAKVGIREMADLDDALASATDPNDRAKLEAMKKDLENWTKERDQRLIPEKQEENELENRIDKLNRELHDNQSRALQEAGWSGGPTTEVVGGEVTASTFMQAQALQHISSLRDMALRERQQLVRIVRGVN